MRVDSFTARVCAASHLADTAVRTLRCVKNNNIPRRRLVKTAGTILLGLAALGAVPSIAAAQAAPAARAELSVDGIVIATFSDVALGVPGGTLSLQPTEAAFLKKLPGRRNPPTVTLKRGKNNSMEIFLWHESVVQGDTLAARKSCSLVMYNTDGKPVARYHLEMAWPAKIEIGALKAGASEVLIETLVLAADQIDSAT